MAKGTIIYSILCHVCKTHYDGTRHPGKSICPSCKAEKNDLRRRKQIEANIKSHKKQRDRKNYKERAWTNIYTGPRGLVKKWLLEFGEKSLTCTRCGYNKNQRLIVLHHKTYFNMGGDHDLDNLEPLCIRCHAEEHDPFTGKGPDDRGY